MTEFEIDLRKQQVDIMLNWNGKAVYVVFCCIYHFWNRHLKSDSPEWGQLDASEVQQVMMLCNDALARGHQALCDEEGQPLQRSARRSRRLRNLSAAVPADKAIIAYDKTKKRPYIKKKVTEYALFRTPKEELETWQLTGPQFLQYQFNIYCRRTCE